MVLFFINILWVNTQYKVNRKLMVKFEKLHTMVRVGCDIKKIMMQCLFLINVKHEGGFL